MNKNVVTVIVVVLVLLGAGGLILAMNKDDTPASSSTDAAEHTLNDPITSEENGQSVDSQDAADAVVVTYSDEGFSPSNVGTIKVGTTIRFVNESSSQMWVASDDHPTHTIYPEFDQNSGSGQGTSYTFVFDKAGTWGFHNHLSSSDTGQVVVEE